MLGQYIGIAFNEPSKYPRKPFTEDSKVKQIQNRDMSHDEMVTSLRAWMGVLGGKEVTANG